ncbi:MAG: penicillin-binding protein 1C, partial [Bacteroidota bacterium]
MDKPFISIVPNKKRLPGLAFSCTDSSSISYILVKRLKQVKGSLPTYTLESIITVFISMKRRVSLVILAVWFIWWLFCLPRPLFTAKPATILLDKQGQLLSARIAADGQWRIPSADTLSPHLIAAVTTFEDKRFFSHWGVDIRALARAIRQNWRAGQTVSGGSTISMQVIRLAKGNPPRTIWQKLLEVQQALRLEWSYDKETILKFWCNHAPFGGNVVGVEAAAWRYYGRPATELSWAEAATLAVLPNSPGLIHPGRSRQSLLEKRNRLLNRLLQTDQLDSLEYELALAEVLPEQPRPLPRHAPHLLDRIGKQEGPGRYLTSIDGKLQREINRIIQHHHQRLAGNQISNLGAMVVEVSTGQTLAYIGNVPKLDPKHSPAVDMVTAPRSPGSLLKPVLYGLALSEGLICPKQLLPDVPTNFGSFHPGNFYESFSGAVAADRSLVRSLNIPFVYLLRDYGMPKYHIALQQYGFSFINHPAEHYGLSLVLGGCEVSMEQITTWFLGLSRQQRYYYQRQGQYTPADWSPPTFFASDTRDPLLGLSHQAGLIDAGAGYTTLQTLRQLERPDNEGSWRSFTGSRPVAWKTGTSFGFRDAWAVGTTPNYVVAVWTGNADGEGRPGLVGVKAAAPVLFDIFRLLPRGEVEWFEAPFDELLPVVTCKESGRPASPHCPRDTSFIPKRAERADVCRYHRPIFTNSDATYRTHLGCWPANEQVKTNWFTLPPRQAFFYRSEHPSYRPLPPWHPDCVSVGSDSRNPMQMI